MSFQKTAAFAAMICVAGMPGAQAQSSAGAKIKEKQAEIPTCTHKIGVLAVREPQNKWWQGLGLESPEALLKVFVQRSGCFTLVDRGAGFEMAQQERALAAGGQLQQGANIGGGQVLAADYILVPDIVSKNANSGGTNVGGLLGGFVGGFAGAIISGISIKSSTADVVLTVTNVRTSAQEAMQEGHGSKTDLSFGVGGGGGVLGGFGAVGVSNYANTEIGQVVTLAYIDAYTKLVNGLGGLSDTPKSDAPSQTVTLSRPGVLHAAANETSATVRPLDAGMILYPTGQKDGVWWEVSDEVGNKGWVSSLSLSNAR
jgi:curli biogenesis system outer membrane secretion channel CsgG